MIRTVLVCEAQVPQVQGGAELHGSGLVGQLRRRGFRAERVSIPFKWYPKQELLAQAAAWRMVDLSESNGEPIDLVIATKFPTYFVRHPNKVTWLFHQYRAIYDLCGTAYSEFDHLEGDVRLRDALIRLDGAAAESGVADRVRFTGGIDDQQLVDLYAGAFAVAFPPYDEDYGYVTLEAFLARKPVITTSDAGGPLEFVDDGVTGLVTEPAPEAFGAAIARLPADTRLAAAPGR